MTWSPSSPKSLVEPPYRPPSSLPAPPPILCPLHSNAAHRGVHQKKGPKRVTHGAFLTEGGGQKPFGQCPYTQTTYQKKTSLTFNKSEQDKMRSQLVKQISIFICLQQTKHICATRILLSSLHHNRLAVFLPAMVQNQSGCFARV